MKKTADFKAHVFWITIGGMIFIGSLLCCLALIEKSQREKNASAQVIPQIASNAKDEKTIQQDQKPVQLEAEDTEEVCKIKDLGNGLYEFYFGKEEMSDFVISDFFKVYLVDFIKKNPNLRIACIYDLHRDHGRYSHAKILVATEEKK